MDKINKATLITGAAGFLGAHHCNTVLSIGNTLVMIDKDKKKLIQVFNKLKKNFRSSKIFLFAADIVNEKKIKDISKKLKRKKIIVNSIINNAAIDAKPSKKTSNLDFVSSKQWRKELDTSLLGSYLIIKHFIKEMCVKKDGKIINIGSDLSVIAPNQSIYMRGGFKNYIKPATYSVVKHGLLGMTKYFSSLYAEKNVRFNMVSPGPIFKNQNKKFINELKKIIPMRRMATPQDLEEVIKFLLNDNSKYVTGQNILIDGGRTII
jgi:NAD(P)-dependent dehydrogenase (short-subunit alcohol dehydrogenase family)|tara:strand:- start:41 stop:832 length:792 start_codon:yes stop_codon:yes gene_type:complete